LRKSNTVQKDDVKSIVFEMFTTRKRFKYKAKDITDYFLHFVCCRRK